MSALSPLRLKIVQLGEPVLRQPGRELSIEEIRSPEIQQLMESMRATMYDAPGVGLAAPQIGLSLRLAVIEDKPDYTSGAPPERLAERERQPVPFHVIVNPRLTLHPEEEVEFYEGCLSFPGYVAKVRRARAVTVHYLNHRGEPQVVQAKGWYARILQHEIDHLDGTVYIDRMDTRTLTGVENLNRFHGGIFERKP